MPQLPDAIRTFLDTLTRIDAAGAIDILLIAGIIYCGFLWLKGTTGMALVRGSGLIIIIALVLGSTLNLTVVNYLLEHSVQAVLVAIPIVFQPEIRRGLEWLGRPRVTTRRNRESSERVLAGIGEACVELSARRLGALIVLERETGLDDYMRTGERIDALVSRSLIVNVFWRNTPLHDGAMVIRESRVAAAGCTLPLSEATLPSHLGTRHRAALGLSERTDAVVVIVSEETGAISLALGKQITSGLDEKELRAMLRQQLGQFEMAPIRLVPRRGEALDQRLGGEGGS